MFKSLFKVNKELKIYSPATGKSYDITKVPDQTFAQKMLGDGFAVSPDNGEIYAPVKGKIVSVAPTKHAIGIEASNGVQILIHMGIDTVNLHGVPFDISVSVGDKVNKGILLAKIDLDYLKQQNIHDDVIVVFTNMNDVEQLNLNNYGPVLEGDLIGICRKS